MTTIRIHLNRHGEVYNPEGILYGRLPGYRLSALGQEMAQRIADHYLNGDYTVAALVCSPLERTAQTIAPLVDGTGIQPCVDPRVIEAGNSFEGQKVNRTSLLQLKNLCRVYNPVRPSWGEPYTQQVTRMRAAMASLRRRLEAIAHRDGHHVIDGVIVSHQLPIWVSRLAAEGRPLAHDPRHRECALGSATSFVFKNGTLTDVTYTDICADIQPAKAGVGA